MLHIHLKIQLLWQQAAGAAVKCVAISYCALEIAQVSAVPYCYQCRGQVGKQVIEHLSVEYVHGLGAFKLKELVDLFGAATGKRHNLPSAKILALTACHHHIC